MHNPGGLDGTDLPVTNQVENKPDRPFPNSSSLLPLLDEEEGTCSSISSDLANIKEHISPKALQSVLKDMCTKRHDLFKDCVLEIEAFLSLEPFQEFKDSLYYGHYLQWRSVERQPVTMKTFYMYRILGKGGFGEVCACQTRSSGYY